MKITLKKVKNLKTNPFQPRQSFDREKLKELAQSIEESDLLQPIIIDEKNRIIAGERRWRAFMLLKRKEIPCIVWQIKDDIEALEKSAIENLQREDLTSVERENIITDLWESGRYKRKVELAKVLGINESYVRKNIEAKIDREKFALGAKIGTITLDKTRGLPDNERKEILKRVERGDLKAGMVEDVVVFKKMQPTERRFKGKIEITPESKKKYIHGKLVQSLRSIVMLSIGWTPERVKLINEYSTPKERKEIVKAVENLVKKWTKILKALKS